MRKSSLDFCRVLACMLVVMIHTVMLFWDFDPNSPVWAVYNLLAVFIRCGVPLFFMISGALLLSRDELEAGKQLRRIGHFLLLYFAWSFICAFVDMKFFHVWYQQASIMELILGSYYHLWYLPAMISCYCILPLLHGLIHRKLAGLKIQHCLLAVIPIAFSLMLPERFGLVNLKYLVYMMLGWWLYARRQKNSWLVPLGILAVAAALVYAELNRRYSISIGAPSTRYYNYTSPAMLLLSSFVFSLCLRMGNLPGRLNGWLAELSACTLGIYLLHPLFISALKSLQLDFSRFNTFVFFPACYLSFFTLSLGLSFILRRVPGIKRLIS